MAKGSPEHPSDSPRSRHPPSPQRPSRFGTTRPKNPQGQTGKSPSSTATTFTCWVKAGEPPQGAQEDPQLSPTFNYDLPTTNYPACCVGLANSGILFFLPPVPRKPFNIKIAATKTKYKPYQTSWEGDLDSKIPNSKLATEDDAEFNLKTQSFLAVWDGSVK